MSYETRDRMSYDEACKMSKSGNMIAHVLDNEDGTYSVMGHINCEHCDYCDLENEWWNVKKESGMSYDAICRLPTPSFIAKPDPYEQQKVTMAENYGLNCPQYPLVARTEVERYWNEVISKTISLDAFTKVLEDNGYKIT